MSVRIVTAPMKYRDPTTGQYVDVVGIQGKGIDTITKTATSGTTDTYTITYTDGTTSNFEIVHEVNGEAYGAGTRNGVEVTSDDPAYHNNAPYYADQAKLWVDGKHIDGTPDSQHSENNAEFHSGRAKEEADRAEQLVNDAEQDISDAGDEQVQAIEDKGAEVLESIPADYTEMSDAIEAAPTDETGQELLAALLEETGLTEGVLEVIGQTFAALPSNETAIDIRNALSLEADRLAAIYELWLAEKEGA